MLDGFLPSPAVVSSLLLIALLQLVLAALSAASYIVPAGRLGQNYIAIAVIGVILIAVAPLLQLAGNVARLPQIGWVTIATGTALQLSAGFRARVRVRALALQWCAIALSSTVALAMIAMVSSGI